MNGPRQRTLARKATLDGVGLHSGAPVSVSVLPADAGSGIRFRRIDGAAAEEVAASLENVSSTDLGTALGTGDSRILTVEHALAALATLRIDNARIEVDGPEVPICDGSFLAWIDALDEAGVEEQDAEAKVITVRRPVSVADEEGQSYVAAPGSPLRISATIDFEHAAIGRQFGSFAVDEQGFRTELASARTFGFKADAEQLRARGLALGASLHNTVVLDENGVMNDDLRFPDEFLRHKVGDVVGDLALLGARLEAHIVAERPSHAGNVALARAIRDQLRYGSREAVIDVTRIMSFLPHRYPMLLVDRIVHVEDMQRIVGIKNVTINEPFFQGHFPGHPIMPGVLIVEAMAQVGGLLLMEKLPDAAEKVVYFMTMDNVKFRRPVTPGDTLVFDLEVIQYRRGVCKMRGRGLVEGHVAAEAEFMASIMDR